MISALPSETESCYHRLNDGLDYIAEYIATVIYSDKADSMERLYRFLDKRGFNTPLEKEIETIYGAGGWLKGFSELRNTIAHRMPFDRL